MPLFPSFDTARYGFISLVLIQAHFKTYFFQVLVNDKVMAFVNNRAAALDLNSRRWSALPNAPADCGEGPSCALVRRKRIDKVVVMVMGANRRTHDFDPDTGVWLTEGTA